MLSQSEPRSGCATWGWRCVVQLLAAVNMRGSVSIMSVGVECMSLLATSLLMEVQLFLVLLVRQSTNVYVVLSLLGAEPSG